MTKGITDIDEGTLRRIDWQELLPPTIFVRTFSMSLSPFAIFVSTFVIAILLMLVTNCRGVSFISFDLSPSIDSPCDFGLDLRKTFDREKMSHTVIPMDVRDFIRYDITPKRMPYGKTSLSWVIQTVCAAVVLFLWLLFARSSAVRLASTQRSTFVHSFRFACRKFKSLILALLLPLAVILFSGLILSVSIFLERTGGCLSILNHLFFPFLLGLALFRIAFIALTACSVPLIISAIATDNSDGFDAFSRAISYVTQRPLHFIFYVLLALIPAMIGGKLMAALTLFVSQNYASHVCGPAGAACSCWGNYWSIFLLTLPVGYLFYYMVIASCALYFMLRRSVDGTPFDQCYTAESHKPSRKLHPIIRDAQGAPVATGSAFDSNDAGHRAE